MDLSIIITSYNYDRFIEECVNSCLRQVNHSVDYEVIVVNDGSTDATSQILASLCAKNLRVYNITNVGIESACNYAINVSLGQFIVRVDADDKLSPNYLSDISMYLSDPNWAFLYGDYYMMDEFGIISRRVVLPDYDPKEIYCRGDFLATGTIYRRELFSTIGTYDVTVKNSGLENYEFILRAISSGFHGKHIKKNLFYYRRHGDSISSQKLKMIVAHGAMLFKAYNLGKYKTNCNHPYGLNLEKYAE